MNRWKDSSRSLLAVSRSFSVNRVPNIIPPIVLFASILWVYQDVEADSCNTPECKACVFEVVPGQLRLVENESGVKKKTEGASLTTPLCVLKVGRKKLLVRMHENQDNLQGDWWIKSRYVLKSNVDKKVNVDVDCSTVVAYTIPGTPGSIGSARGSGEDPCK